MQMEVSQELRIHMLRQEAFPEQQPEIQMTRHCPCCKSRNKYRIRRLWWMRLIPFSKHYRCLECDYSFLSFRRN